MRSRDELCETWETMQGNGEAGKGALRRLRQEIDDAGVPFEDWTRLENIWRHAERDLARPHSQHVKETAMATEKSTADLVEEAVDEAKRLVRLEVQLAKDETRTEVKQLEGAAAAFAAGGAALIVCLALFGVAIVLAAGATVVAALIVAACFFALAGDRRGRGLRARPEEAARTHPRARDDRPPPDRGARSMTRMGKPTTMDHDEQLQREADMTRRRLLNTVDELDARKHQLESLRLVPMVLAAIGGIVLLTSAYGALTEWSRRHRRRRAPRRWAKALHLR